MLILRIKGSDFTPKNVPVGEVSSFIETKPKPATLPATPRRTLISFSKMATWARQIFCKGRGSSLEIIVIAPVRG